MTRAGKKTRNLLFPVWRKARRLSPASTERLTHVLTDEAGTPMPRPERRAFADNVAFMAAHHDWRDLIADTANRALDEAFRKAWRPATTRRR
ncbi:MAG TPA: hypothetical protein VK540_28745 [Polyangiaceae bacterium]|nr:hypothetical protein [Polyangiaceae bacterium]